MKKILISLIIIILIGGICYFIYNKYNSTNKPSNEEIKKTSYNDEKSIIINNKKYTIGLKKYGKNYELDKISDSLTGVIELYLNDVKIKTITYKIDSVNPEDVIVSIESYKFSNDYILVSITYSDGIEINYNDFYVFNIKGEFVGEATWDGFGMKELTTSKILTFEINDDNLIIYNKNSLTKVSYTIVNNEFTKNIIKTYNNNEVELINK